MTKDEHRAVYRHSRFSITMIVNTISDDPDNPLYNPAATIEVDANKLFGGDESDCLEHSAKVCDVIIATFGRLARQWRDTTGYEPTT